MTIILVGILVSQCRRPWGWLGRRVARAMNITHSRLTDWGLGHVAVQKDHTILDVGCGGGETVHKLAALASDGKVYGIDYSKASVATSRIRNAQLIQAGRVAIGHGSVSHLPFPDRTFDLVTAVETHLSAHEHSRSLSTAGYSDVEIRVEARNRWLCAIARRPA